MKSVLVILAIVIMYINCRSKIIVDPNEYYESNYQPASGIRKLSNRSRSKRLRKQNKKEEGAALQADKIIVNENVLSGQVCDVEARDYKQINICGCKFWGFLCKSYRFIVDTTVDDPSKTQPRHFHVQSQKSYSEADRKIRYENQLEGIIKPEEDFTMFKKVGECKDLCSKFNIFQSWTVSQEFARLIREGDTSNSQDEETSAPASSRLKSYHKRSSVKTIKSKKIKKNRKLKKLKKNKKRRHLVKITRKNI